MHCDTNRMMIGRLAATLVLLGLKRRMAEDHLCKLLFGDQIIVISVKLLEQAADGQDTIRDPLQQLRIAQCSYLKHVTMSATKRRSDILEIRDLGNLHRRL